MTDAPGSLVIQYVVLRGTRSGRAKLADGQPSYGIDDISFFDITLSVGETHTFTSSELLVLELEQPLEVTMTLTGNNGTPVTVIQDLGGLVVMPAKTSISISNPSRFAYTTSIGVRAVTG